MGSPAYYSDDTNNESGYVRFSLEWLSGATGAVPALTSFAHMAAGYVTSVVRTGVGAFTITLKDQWSDLIEFHGWTLQASYSASGACQVQITGNNTATSPSTITILTTNAAGAATDPTTNDDVYVNLVMQSYQA